MSEEAATYHISVKNTFLDFCPMEEVPPVPRRKSWSSGDPWPTGVDLFDSKQGQEAENDTCDTTSHEHEPHVAVAHESLKLERHRTGRCKPCVFFASRHGCADSSCGFCHLAHKSPKRRPQKQTRDFFKATVEEAFQRQDGQALRIALQRLATRDQYMHSFIIGQTNQYPERFT